MSKIARDNRNRDLGQIHLAKKTLTEAGVFQTDEDYRQMLRAQAGVDSSARLDFAGRRRVLAHMHSLVPASVSKPKPTQPPLTAKQKLMWSLWQQLADAKVVTNRRMPALQAFVKRQTGVDRLEWLTGAQEDLVVESLKEWLNRLPSRPRAAA